MAVIDEFLIGMLEEGGSDLHVRVDEPLRIRLHGELAIVDALPLTREGVESLLREVCPPGCWADFLKSHDVDFAYEIPLRARFRCNYLMTRHGAGAVFRNIPTRIKTIDDLGLPDVLRRVCQYRQGLVLVTGPTGSGKSTTMAAMVDHINRTSEKHIITIEHPIEFVHRNLRSTVVHRELGEHTDSYEAALRSAMRGDPDIVLVGELRDLETIRLALSCATMGMLVFGTLHTTSAAKTIDRLIDVFPGDQQALVRVMLADSLRAVVSQQLCRTADGRGRVAAHEILLHSDALANAIREGQLGTVRIMMESGGSDDMCTLDRSLRQLLEAGRITPMEAYVRSASKDEFERYLPASPVDSVAEGG